MNLLASVLRTLVPLLAGWLLTVAGWLGIEADSAAVAGGVTAAVSAVYYLLFRLAEQAADRLGWAPLRVVAGVLLGWARPPQYEQSTTVPLRVRIVPEYDAEAFAKQVATVVERGGGSLR